MEFWFSTLLFDTLTLAGLGALGDGFAEHGHEFGVFASGEAGKLAELILAAQLDSGCLGVVQNLQGEVALAYVAYGYWY